MVDACTPGGILLLKLPPNCPNKLFPRRILQRLAPRAEVQSPWPLGRIRGDLDHRECRDVLVLIRSLDGPGAEIEGLVESGLIPDGR